MRRRSFQPGLWAVLLGMLASCQASPSSMGSQIQISLARLDQTASTDVSGSVLAPAGYTADSDASAVQLQATGDRALANVPIYLADFAGKPLTGATIRSDAQGHYDLATLPIGVTVVLVAKLKGPDGRPATLLALARASGAAEHVDLSVASTLVASRLLKMSWNPDNFRPDTFAAAVALVSQQALPSIDLSDSGAVVAAAQAQMNANCAIGNELQEIAVGQAPNPGCSYAPVTPSPSPSQNGDGGPVYSSGGGGSGGGGSASAATPTPGSITTQISIHDGPVVTASPTP